MHIYETNWKIIYGFVSANDQGRYDTMENCDEHI
jgi:hypothetical protein